MRASFLALASLCLLPTLHQAGQLEVGSPAPPISVSAWVKGEPVNAYQPGHTYVVEFWATWCGPCKVSIPHLTKLQKEYAGQATVIGVSVWEQDQELVSPFVEKMGDKMDYVVAADKLDGERGAMATTWMEAAGRSGIPAAFIVDGEGRIAWIGHPMGMDDPLGKIIAGEWDIEAAAKSFRMQRDLDANYKKASEAMRAAMKEGDWKKVVMVTDEIIALDASFEGRVAPVRFEALLNMKAWAPAYGYAREVLAGVGKDSPGLLNALAWTLVDPDKSFEKVDLDVALNLAQRASELTGGEEPSILDTLALVQFERGEIEDAVRTQAKAVELAPEGKMKEELTQRLEAFRKAAKTRGA